MKKLYAVLIFIGIILGIIYIPYYFAILLSKFFLIKLHGSIDTWLVGAAMTATLIVVVFISGLSITSIYQGLKSNKK